jgi:hypothetical protein
VPGLVATVAPVIAHVNRVTAQLSAKVGLLTATLALQEVVEVKTPMLAGHEIVGAMLSTTVTVNEQFAVLP